MKVFLDTCSLLWWSLDQAKLSAKAQRFCKRIFDESALVSAVSFWEIGVKIKKKKLDIGISVEEFLKGVKETQCIEIIPVDEVIWLKSLQLKWKHPDPADRVIVATAELYKSSIITQDKKIRRFYKKSIW